MDGPQRRDINELLTNGFFKTSRAKSPSSAPPPSTYPRSFLQTRDHEVPRQRSRSRGPRRPPPPRPTVEDEAVSLSRESSPSIPSYDPPLRGIIDQNPIILEAAVDEVEAARLQKGPYPKEDLNNAERRFVMVSKDESSSDERGKRPARTKTTRPERPTESQPPLNKRPSRQDLPSLETKIPRDIPPKFRRSASAAADLPNDRDATPKAHPAPRAPSGEYFLSPANTRASREYFSQSAPRYQESFGERDKLPTEKRHSGSSYGSYTGSRPTTPEKRSSNRESSKRDEDGGRRELKQGLPNDRLATDVALGLGVGLASGIASGRSSRSSNYAKEQYSSSEDDVTDSDNDRYRRRNPHDRLKREEYTGRSSSRRNKTSLEPKQGSRLSSPLPSPKVSPSSSPRVDQFGRADTFPRASRRPVSRPVSPTSDDRRDPRSDRLNQVEAPKLRQSSTAPNVKTTAPYPEALPIPIPGIDMQYPSDHKIATIPHFDNSPRAPPSSHWQPPPLTLPAQHLEQPIGSFRRYSEEIERGSVAPLPTCPRRTPVRGKRDWLTLPQCPAFDICPSCFASSIEPTEFRTHFITAKRNPDLGVVCDFGSSPWYRIAWLLTLKEKRRDLKLFYGLADIAERAPPCLGKHEASRQWHSIIDYKSGRTIPGFDACSSCVRSVEILLPAVRGVFVRTDPKGETRICDLRFDSKRFVKYFDALETAADKADFNNVPPDTRNLADLVKRLTFFDECQQEMDLVERRWNVITQLPDFTVCDECFDEVVWPELKNGKTIPEMFAKEKKRFSKASCQLYSPKMREIFRLAVDNNDYMMLAAKARERKGVELVYKNGLLDVKRGLKSASDLRRVEDEWRRWE